MNPINNTLPSLERTEARHPARKDASKPLDKTIEDPAGYSETALDRADKVEIATQRSETMASNTDTLKDHDEALKVLEDIKAGIYEKAETQNQDLLQVHNLKADNLAEIL